MSARRIRTILTIGISLFLAAICFATTPEDDTDPSSASGLASQEELPPWAPPPGQEAQYSYLYYPDASVYFDMGRELYFYLFNGRWLKSSTLPEQFQVSLGSFVILDMMTEKPYEFYPEVMEAYPPSMVVAQETQEDPPPWAPAHGHKAKYQYQYYPASSMYYDTLRNLYFYLLDGRWIKAPTLAEEIQVDLGDFVTLDMMTGNPYEFHEEVVKVYPPVIQGVRAYQYRYYPAASVYYDLGRSVYHYFVDNQWQTVRTLPDSIHLNTREFATFELDTDRPYIYHQEVIKRYPAKHVKYHYKEHVKVDQKAKVHHKKKIHYKKSTKIKHQGKVHYKKQVKVHKHKGKVHYKKQVKVDKHKGKVHYKKK
jgi:hypothetical protein